jgi:DNA-binding PadR family transcriptional regulator
VFGHGRLRLYLLWLLDESPRHGYDVIRLLEDRFMGLYAPSAGTVYPRLARLESEGLVSHHQEGGRKVYTITEAGREELNRRRGELAELEADIRSSVREMAREIRDETRSSAKDLQRELRHAAGQIRREQRHANRQERKAWEEADRAWWSDPSNWGVDPSTWDARKKPGKGERDFEEKLMRFLDGISRLLNSAQLGEGKVGRITAILDDAAVRIRAVLAEADGPKSKN